MKRKELILKSLLVVTLYFGITYLISLNNYLYGDFISFNSLGDLLFVLRESFVSRVNNIILIVTCLVFFIFFKVLMNRRKSFANINDLIKLAGLFVLFKGLFDVLEVLSKIVENIYLFNRPSVDLGPNSLSVFTILFELLFGLALLLIFRKDAFAQENDKDKFCFQVRIVAMYFALFSFLGIVNYFISVLFIFNTSLGNPLFISYSNTDITVLIQQMPNGIPFIIGLIILIFTKDIPRTVKLQKNYFSFMVVAILLLFNALREAISIITLLVTMPNSVYFLNAGIWFVLRFSVIFLLVFFAEKRLRAHKLLVGWER